MKKFRVIVSLIGSNGLSYRNVVEEVFARSQDDAIELAEGRAIGRDKHADDAFVLSISLL